LGFISFGGPAGQIAVMHQELVEQKRWISENVFYMLSTTACYCLGLKHNN
jgi:chromate transport protein ChrA